MRRAGHLGAWAGVILALQVPVATADPWLAPGDEVLRSDIELLADSGVLPGPVTTWPLSWPDVARAVLAADDSQLDSGSAEALLRVQRLARASSAMGFAGAGIRIRGASDPNELRTFADDPREEGELTLRASWLGEFHAINLQGTVVSSPEDRKQVRPDGSYLGVNIGNFMVSAGFMERWWGPGWDGSLILSTNARPIPSLTVERNYTDPFKSPWLSWIGYWRASIAVGEAESHDAAVPNVRFLAARVNFKPRHWLEFGLTRTAQWCGGERPCDLGTLTDLLVGRDNQTADGLPTLEQPGNQMAGYDMRLRSPWKPLHLVLHTQWIGEDEAGGLPSRFMGQFGLETWGSSMLGNWRIRAEFADTTCAFTRNDPYYDCGYRNGIYPQGYAFRGRMIGHAMDNDSRMYSLGGQLTRPSGDSLSLAIRQFELNRDGGLHAIFSVPTDLKNVELRYSRALFGGKFVAGIGYDDPVVGEGSSRVHGSLSWQQGF